MSVINQMLQDLDNRKPVIDTGTAITAQVRVAARRERAHQGWWAIVLLGMTMVIVGSLWLLQPGHGADRRWRPAAMNASRPMSVAGAPAALQVSAPIQAPVSTTASPVGLPDQLITLGLKTTNWLDLSRVDNASPKPPRAALHVDLAPAPPLPLPTAPVSASASVAERPPRQAIVVSATAAPALPAAAVNTATRLPIKETTPKQRADSEYGRALTLLQEDRSTEAGELLASVLQLDPGNAAARQSQVSMLVAARRYPEAERSLQDGLKFDRNQVALAMILARLQVEQGDAGAGLKTLQLSLSAGADRAEYQGFLAALLQREGRHRDAIEHYQYALRKVPGSGVWLTGMGISLQAENRVSEAQEAFMRAQASASLAPDLKLFVDQQLRQGGLR